MGIVEELFQILNSLHDTKFPHDQRGLYLSKIEAIQYIYKKSESITTSVLTSVLTKSFDNLFLVKTGNLSSHSLWC